MKIKWNPNALYEVRRSGPVQAAIHTQAAQIASRAGDGYSWDSQQGRRAPQGRWRAIVFPETWRARRDNARNNTLVRSLH